MDAVCNAIITPMKILAGIMTALVFSVMFIGLLSVATSMEMSHGHGMSDCPFMAHGEVVCAMSVSDHLSAWKGALLGVAPTIVSLLTTAAVAFVLATVLFFDTSQRRIVSTPLWQLRERTYTFIYRSLQELFSDGILHTRVFL